MAAARREPGQLTVEEYAKQWRPWQRRMTDHSTGWHVDSSINVHIVPRLGSRKLNSVTPMVMERFLDEMEYDVQELLVVGEDLALKIVMMAGCGLRNGEARAVNVHHVVA
ncbi:hypothetical protein [Streptomyces sp. NPDC048142]|uniref:hypothetical protein n=1 Tax=Streptomyces sp. NPDC048142 TaxID=3365501 RepID=UPI0037224F1A